MSVANKGVITLKGSAQLVTEFFGYGINSILYQRGIYPAETFTAVQKYGLNILVTNDDKLKAYLNNVLKQLKEWLLTGTVQRVVVVVVSAETAETLERWVFDIVTDLPTAHSEPREKSPKEITGEIQAIIRQICASVTFLPLLHARCTFDILIYTDKNTEVPLAWEESDPKEIANAQAVRLRSFDTKIHRVDAMVAYAVETGDD
ncbi:MAD2 mitotic arrest deficient-like 1 [Balamuthia mandrillaris]